MKKQIQVILMFTFLFSLTGCAAQKEDTKKEIYLQLYSLRDDVKEDFDKTIAAVAEMGYTGVEAAGYADGKFYGRTPAEYRAALEEVGLVSLSSHAGHNLAENPAETDWDAVWQWWDEAIAAHKEAGMQYIVTAWMPTPATLADLQIYCDYYNQIGEKCNAAGIRYGYHNHAFEFEEIEGELMYDYLLQNTDPEKVFFQMDVYWTVMGGKSPVEYFQNYPGRFELLHIKDDKELGESGMVGFDAIFKHAETAGSKDFVVEVEKYNFTPLESVKKSFDYLNSATFYPSK